MLIANVAYISMGITEVLNKVKRKNYSLKFRREATCLYCFELSEFIMPEDFTVDEYYYFQVISNPAEDRILYAISSSEGIKGFLVDTHRVYMDNVSPEMLHKLEFEELTANADDSVSPGITNKNKPVYY
jgi:hypothetical protein